MTEVTSSSHWEIWSRYKASSISQLLCPARTAPQPLYISRLADSNDRRDLPDWRLRVCMWSASAIFLTAEKCILCFKAPHLLLPNARWFSYYSISNRFKFTVVSLQSNAHRLATNSPSSSPPGRWLLSGNHSLSVRLTYSLSLWCCSLVGPPRCTRLLSGVCGLMIILVWNC